MFYFLTQICVKNIVLPFQRDGRRYVRKTTYTTVQFIYCINMNILVLIPHIKTNLIGNMN